MKITVNAQLRTRKFHELIAYRGGHRDGYCRMLGQDLRVRGRVLEVGCGSKLNPDLEQYNRVLKGTKQLDGVDPDPGIMNHPVLTNRWIGEFEKADIPSEEYDAIVSHNVAEHVVNARSFMEAAHRVLKSGGVIYALTPHAQHPFVVGVRTVQSLGMRGAWKKRLKQQINEYPAYYRLNRRRSIVRAARGLGFAHAELQYYPCVQWDMYFPRPLRVIPHVFDRLAGIHFRWCAMILIFKIEKAPS